MYMLFILLCFNSKLKEIQMFPFVKNVTFRKKIFLSQKMDTLAH